jgi:predicted component of type VI protein secretion system
VLSDFTVSATHVRLRFLRGGVGVWVQDAGSRNGTSHNGLVLIGVESRELMSGDELSIGKYVFLCLNAPDFHAYLTGKL